jgi:hypothetical protein
MPIPQPNYFTNKGYKPKGEKTCECCGKIIILYLQRDFKRKRFCSRQCFGKVNSKINNSRPPKATEESRRKGGKTLSIKMKLCLVPKPPKPTPESRIKAGLKIRGEKHPFWIKDRSKVKRSRFDNSFRGEGPINSWRNSVYRRDKFTCQNCNKIGGKLNAHHIKPWAKFPDDRFNISNGVTLCVNCHKEIHKSANTPKKG